MAIQKEIRERIIQRNKVNEKDGEDKYAIQYDSCNCCNVGEEHERATYIQDDEISVKQKVMFVLTIVLCLAIILFFGVGGFIYRDAFSNRYDDLFVGMIAIEIGMCILCFEDMEADNIPPGAFFLFLGIIISFHEIDKLIG